MLDDLLGGALVGRSGVLAVYGEPGVGKTALLEYAIDTATDFRVERSVGVEGEMELAYAALQQLCSPILGLRGNLPDPQREALEVALGLAVGSPPNPFLVGVAALGLLTEAAADRPLLCVVDDAQWVDLASMRVLVFVARRLLAEKIGLVFAARERIDALRSFAELRVEPLGHRDARALLESVLPARLDERVLDRIVIETNGNPLALMELPRDLTPAQLAGGFGLPAALPLSTRIEESFVRRLGRLPQDARRLLLVAAADPTGDLALESRAARILGIADLPALGAGLDGLLAFDGGVIFRHPLVRSAVYRVAAPDERRAVHHALATATDPAVDPDRRAWHRALAAATPDEDVAAELERSAARAQARGGFAAAGAFLERSSALTIDPVRRAARALAAAEAKQQAGALDDALALASSAEAGPLDESQRAQIDVLRGRIAFAVERGGEAPQLLLGAARRLESLDGPAARDIYLDALTAALFAGRLGGAVDTRQVAAAALAAPPPQSEARAADLLLDGLALLITDGAAAGTPVLRKALISFGDSRLGTDEGLRWLWLAGRAAGYVWDYENWDALSRKQIRLARESGALTVLPLGLTTLAGFQLFAGNLLDARSLVDEANAVSEATDGGSLPYAALVGAAFGGREPDASRLIQADDRGIPGARRGHGPAHARAVGKRAPPQRARSL